MINVESTTSALQVRYRASLPNKRASMELAWRAFCADRSNPERLESLSQLVHRLAGSAPSYGYAEIGEIAGSADALLGQARQSGEAGSRAAGLREFMDELSPLIARLLDALNLASSAPGHLPQTPSARHS